jgi:hypothetical protein
MVLQDARFNHHGYIHFIKYYELCNTQGRQQHKITYCELGSPGVQHGLFCRNFCSYLVLVCYLVIRITQVPVCNILRMTLQLVFWYRRLTGGREYTAIKILIEKLQQKGLG